MAGTNFFTKLSAYVNVAFTDTTGLVLWAECTGDPASLATETNTYQIGCRMVRLDNGTSYQNTGSATTPTWTVNGVGASGTSGATGASGTSGFSGKSGTSGTSGHSGTSGTSA